MTLTRPAPYPGGLPRYNPPVHVLFVCTANICRSPMASALFAAQVDDPTGSVGVDSAGILAGHGSIPVTVPDEVRTVMVPYGIDLRDHHSQALTEASLDDTDLVVGMGRRHVQEAILLDPASWPHSFMLKELVRRGERIGPRPSDQSIGSWIEDVHGDRDRASLIGRSRRDEVADPYGRKLADYRATALELAGLTGRLADLLWPDRPRRSGG